MKSLVLMLGFALISMVGFSQANAINGIWFNPEKDGKIDIYESGGKYYGKLVWIQNQFEDDGKTPRKDSKNKNSSLRSRPLLNIMILNDFKYENGKWVDGTVYDPKSGKTYTSNMTLKGDKLEVRGYVGTPMFGRTAIFTRQ
ncbi:DUF2147 domain-containing protein [Chitinophaga silvatica]|uniref:DUF2147 domain-containing protein n=1 Tax=Chitinophaga silvatica TaxID=2282649 RepID=A0A3E1YAU2_9BACT|nr:DUF2147 domain-containing protein [Chitinophaga silvatica]RFS22795.1 DUF2147 domain-containing protein [Chitinophaga silvatica]